MAEASPDKREQRLPTEFSSWSNQPGSCRKMAANDNFLRRLVRISPLTANDQLWVRFQAKYEYTHTHSLLIDWHTKLDNIKKTLNLSM